MTIDPYVDPAGGVLLNKLGITNAETLQQVVAEDNISAAVAAHQGNLEPLRRILGGITKSADIATG
ncbi:MAG TPA: hypothetical protein DGG94_06875 [Micromonosporaceae bacterium]|nr:hypothetical protein [Micromonosporaceae bacterium]HCU49510.1 hypothetical protein [Micromonosporaceae bacterium]